MPTSSCRYWGAICSRLLGNRSIMREGAVSAGDHGFVQFRGLELELLS